MRVAIIGTGYVGLISGVCLADVGHTVTCVDLNRSIVEKLNSAIPTIYEEGLPELLHRVVKSENFKATDNIEIALNDADIVLVAVGTPSVNGAIDLSFIENACVSIGKHIKRSDKFIAVVIKSTVIPATTDTFVKNTLEAVSGKKLGEFGLGMNPEFLREGRAISDFSKPDRIIFGHEDFRTLELLEELYRSWQIDKVAMNCRSAELVKYANNALLATQISAINELANFSSKLGGVDFDDVCSGVHLDKRWSPILDSGDRVQPEILSYLIPGCGFGGSCFPKDVQALRTQGQDLGLRMQLLNAVLDINELQPHQVTTILKSELGDLLNRKVLILGLSFKPDTDDVRESPSLKIIPDLLREGSEVLAHDPVATIPFEKKLGSASNSVIFVGDWISVIDDVEIIILATAWKDYHKLNELDLAGKFFFDCRGLFEKNSIAVKSHFKFGNT